MAATTRLTGAKRCAASLHATSLASRGGDFHSSFQPVIAPTTKSVWATMRSGASSIASRASRKALCTSFAPPPKRPVSRRMKTAATPSRRGSTSIVSVPAHRPGMPMASVPAGVNRTFPPSSHSSAPSTTYASHSGADT